MSSMRNAVQRRNHKERAQPKEREKWGVLEKHKDYSLRAADYNAKKARLKILRQKAAERNPDEFYFGMYSSKTHDKGQKLADRGNQVLSQDAVKLLKTQDAGYLKTMAEQTRRARERLERAFVLKGNNGIQVRGQKGKRSVASKAIFVDNEVEQQLYDSAPSNPEHSLIEMGNRSEVADGTEPVPVPAGYSSTAKSKSRQQLEAEETALRQARIIRKRRKRDEEAQSSRLKALKSRERDLLAAEQELGLQRAKMSNSVGGINKAGIKWKIRERKR